MRRPVLIVVAAVIERDGLILIGQRKKTDRHPLKWEFPGGKVELNETPREALVRELREELGIEASIGPEMIRYEFSYARRAPILLIFHRVTHFEGEPVSTEFEQIRWEPARLLARYDFLEGDQDFIRLLAKGAV